VPERHVIAGFHDLKVGGPTSGVQRIGKPLLGGELDEDVARGRGDEHRRRDPLDHVDRAELRQPLVAKGLARELQSDRGSRLGSPLNEVGRAEEVHDAVHVLAALGRHGQPELGTR
jgi:hypothetical protein